MEIVNRADNGITNFQSLDLISKLNLERSFWLLSQTGKSNWNILPGDSALLEVFKRKLCRPSTIYSSSFFFPPAKILSSKHALDWTGKICFDFQGQKDYESKTPNPFLAHFPSFTGYCFHSQSFLSLQRVRLNYLLH